MLRRQTRKRAYTEIHFQVINLCDKSLHLSFSRHDYHSVNDCLTPRKKSEMITHNALPSAANKRLTHP